MAIPWYYIWSPKYEIFHQILSKEIKKEPTKFTLCDKFYPQEAFTTLYNPNSEHFFAGNTFKFDVIIDALESTTSPYIIASDADLVPQYLNELADYLEKYKEYDIVYMRDNFTNETLNIGFGLIKNTPKTLSFFKQVRDEIRATGNQDQAIVNKFLQSSDLKYTMFSVPEIIQSNMYNTIQHFYIKQMLCSNHPTFELNYYEKLGTAAWFIDLCQYRHLISNSVWNTLVNYFNNRQIYNPVLEIGYIYQEVIE